MAEAQLWIVRGGAQPCEGLESPRGVVPILEQRLGGPDLNRGIRREALRGNLEQARRVSGAAQLLVDLGLLNEASQEQSRDILGIAAADADAAA